MIFNRKEETKGPGNEELNKIAQAMVLEIHKREEAILKEKESIWRYIG